MKSACRCVRITCAMRRRCSLGERQVLLRCRAADRRPAAVPVCLVADQVRRVREAIQVKLVEDHALEIRPLWPSIHAGNFSDSAPRSPARSRVGRLPPLGQPVGGAAGRAAPAGEPDLIVVNARVLTSDTALPRAEAFAVKNGRFTAVGSTGDVRNLATARTPVIDAQRMTVVPGFIDAHSHPSGVEELYGVNTNLRTVREIQAAIRAKVETTRAGGLDHRLHVRRHQARSSADAQGSRRGDDRASGVGRAPRRPHQLLQQQGVRARRHHRRRRPTRPTAASSRRTAS